MERQGKRLHQLLRVDRLNAMTQEEYDAMVATPESRDGERGRIRPDESHCNYHEQDDDR